MGGKASRDKGGRGEREVIALLQPVVDHVCGLLGVVRLELQRNPRQRYAPKLYDLIGVPWIALEVKRVENLSGLGSWWRQTLAATREHQIPVLFYRQNHGKWNVRMRVPIKVSDTIHVRATVTVDAVTFQVWFQQLLLHHLS